MSKLPLFTIPPVISAAIAGVAAWVSITLYPSFASHALDSLGIVVSLWAGESWSRFVTTARSNNGQMSNRRWFSIR